MWNWPSLLGRIDWWNSSFVVKSRFLCKIFDWAGKIWLEGFEEFVLLQKIFLRICSKRWLFYLETTNYCWLKGCGGDHAVSVLTFYSDNPSLNPAESLNFYCDNKRLKKMGKNFKNCIFQKSWNGLCQRQWRYKRHWPHQSWFWPRPVWDPPRGSNPCSSGLGSWWASPWTRVSYSRRRNPSTSVD